MAKSKRLASGKVNLQLDEREFEDLLSMVDHVAKFGISIERCQEASAWRGFLNNTKNSKRDEVIEWQRPRG